MRIRGFWRIGGIAAVAGLVGALLAIPAWAAPTRQADDPVPDAYSAMHEACEAGDVQGMAEAMDSLTEEDREAMEEHMSDGHQETMGSGVMGMGGMMGGWFGSSRGGPA